MKKLAIIGNLIFAGALMMASCDSATSEKVEEKVDTMASNIGAAVDSLGNNDADDDADFVQDVTRSNAMELHMLAQGRTMGTNAELKSAAKKMETDHKKLASEMREYAAKKNIALDTADMDHHDDAADDKKGVEWDKEWIDDMVEDHEKDIKKFEDAENDVKDPELKAMITKTLPILREHLEMSKKLQEKLNK
jgi:putative membrane protein